jgi:transposase
MHDCEAVEAELRLLRARLAELENANSELRSRLSDLQPVLERATAALNQAQAKDAAKPDNRKSKRKKPGARNGHAARHRPTPEIDEEKDAILVKCPACDTRLDEPIETRERIVEDIVPARVHVTKYRVHRYWCPTCKVKVEAEPEGVLPEQRFGLRLMLLVVFLRTLGLTVEKIRAHLRESFGVQLSHGAVIHVEAVVAEALGPLYAELLEELRKAKSVHADETSWRIDGEKHWLWVLLGKGVAVFAVRDTRSRRPIEEHLGPDYEGVVVTDFYPSFRNLPYEKQKCLVHLLREIHRFEAKPDFQPGKEWTQVRRRVKRLVTEAVEGHENLKDPGERAAFKARLVKRAEAIAQLPRSHKYALILAKLVGQYTDQLFTFLTREGVHWENNPAERGLRPMVVNRKVSFGSKSEEGAERRAVLQSVAETAHLRGKSFLHFAGQAVGLSPQERLPGP